MTLDLRAAHAATELRSMPCAAVDVWNSPAGSARDGGDWAETFPASDRELLMTVGDVSGHGDAVAARKALVRTQILHAMRLARSPAGALARVNAFILREAEESLVTAVVASFDAGRRTLTFANAGHPPPLLVADGRATYLTAATRAYPLGAFADFEATDTTVTLPASALVVFYTDGVTEHGRDPILGEVELAAAGCLVAGCRDANLARAVADEVFRTGRGLDDAAILVLRTPASAIRHARDRGRPFS